MGVDKCCNVMLERKKNRSFSALLQSDAATNLSSQWMFKRGSDRTAIRNLPVLINEMDLLLELIRRQYFQSFFSGS